MAIAVLGLFETHLTVKNLAVSTAFYRDVVGLEVAYTLPDRRVAFFWVGGHGQGMLSLWEVGTAPIGLHLHFAFRTTVDQVLAAPAVLRAAGVTPRGFHGEPVEEPIVFAWMPAISLYFSDPDGHSVEYLAMLPGESRPAVGVVPWSRWQSLQQT
jgi:lactoylglutathione lyase